LTLLTYLPASVKILIVWFKKGNQTESSDFSSGTISSETLLNTVSQLDGESMNNSKRAQHIKRQSIKNIILDTNITFELIFHYSSQLTVRYYLWSSFYNIALSLQISW